MILAAARRPAVVWASAAVILLSGAVAFTRLPLATRTAVELPRLSVMAAWPGAAPEVVEAYVTSPLESAVMGVRGVKSVSSTSTDNLSSLTVMLEPRSDVQLVRLGILERLEILRKELPPGVSQPAVSNYVPADLDEAPLLSLVITGPYTSGALQAILQERVAPRLSGVPGVAGTRVRGGVSTEVSVRYDPVLLRRIGIPPERLTDAINQARIVQSVGVLRNGSQVQTVVLRDQPEAIDSINSLPVTGPRGRIFRLGELASVRVGEDDQGRFYRINGVPAVSVDVTRHSGADAIRTAQALRAVVEELAPTMPPAIRLAVTNDSSVDLADQLNDLMLRGAIAFVSVLLVLVALLRNWRAVALVMGSTSVAIAATALTLYVAEIPANLLTLAGLGMGVGILVQNAVVVVERLSRSDGSPEARGESTRRIAPAIYGSTLTTAVVLLPFLYLQGDARAAFVPFALAFVIALFWSVVTSLLVVPALGKGVAARDVSLPWLRRAYVAVVTRSMRWRPATLLLTVSVLAALTWVFIEKIPRYSWSGFGGQRSMLGVFLTFPRGSDPATLDQVMQSFERIVVGRHEVEQVRTESGGPTSAQMSVLFTREGSYGAAPLQMQEELTQRAVLVGGASVSVQGTGPGFSSGGGSSTSSTFSIQLRGFSYDGVSRLADDIRSRLQEIPRVTDVRISSGRYFGGEAYSSQVVLEPDREALSIYGLTAASFAAGVAREMRGPVGGQRLEVDGDEMQVTVKALGSTEASMSDLQDALLSNPRGAAVRVRDVAVVGERPALSAVLREDQQYLRTVSYSFRGPAKLANRTHEAFLEALAAPPGYSIQDGRYMFSLGDDGSVRGLWVVFAMGVILVILSVALVFDSVWGAAMVLLSLPVALGGVILAFWLLGAAFTREAAVGVILVVGLAVNQAILLVDAVLLQRVARGRVRAGMILRSVLDRGPMIVVITLAALASLLPLSLGTRVDTLFGAIALATAGGTLAGTLGVLFILPAVMMSWKRRRPRKPA